MYISTHIYAAKSDKELTLEKGDVLLGVSKMDDNWFYGTIKDTDRSGLVPINFLKLHHFSPAGSVML